MSKRRRIIADGSNEELETEMMKRGDVDLLKRMAVQRILYTKLELKGKPPVLKVNYFCGVNHVKEVLFFENTGFARTKAEQWWRQRSSTEPPKTIDEALAQQDSLRQPSQLLVHINKTYPEIVDYFGDLIR